MAKAQIVASGKQAFSKHLKELMDEHGDTQSDLASAIDVQRQSIGYYLSGDRNPGADIVKRIAEKYNVSADWLLGLSKDRRRENREPDNLGISDTTARFIKDLDNDTKDDIDDLVLQFSDDIEGLLLELSYIIHLMLDIRNGHYPTMDYFDDLHNSACLEKYPYELLTGHSLLFYKIDLLKNQFSDFLNNILSQYSPKKKGD